MEKYVRFGMQIRKVVGNYRQDGIGVFHWKTEDGGNCSTISQWTYDTETSALTELLEDLEFHAERARERLYEIEGLE